LLSFISVHDDVTDGRNPARFAVFLIALTAEMQASTELNRSWIKNTLCDGAPGDPRLIATIIKQIIVHLFD